MLLQRDVPEQFQVASKAAPEGGPVQFQGGAVLLQRESSAAPEGGRSSSGMEVPEQFQWGASPAPDAGSSAASEGGSRAAPEGREHLGRPMDSTSADPACPLLRGYVLTQAIDIFHIPYPLCLLVVKPIDTPSFSTGRGREKVAGAIVPPCFVSRSASDPLCNGHCGGRSSTPHGEVAPAK